MHFKTRFLVLILLSVQTLCAQQAVQDSTKCVQLIKSAERDPSNAPAYLKQAELLATSSYLMQLLNKEWAYYYQGNRLFDSALLAIDRNLIPTYLDDTSRQVQLQVAKSYTIKRGIIVSIGRFQDAFEPMFKAKAIYDHYDVTEIDRAYMLLNIAIDYWRINDFQTSLDWLDETISFSEKYQHDNPLLPAYITKGLVYFGLNQLNLAEEYYLYVLELIGNDIEQNARDFMATCNNLGLVYIDLEQYEDAESYFQKGMDLVESGKIEASFSYLIPYYSSVFQVNLGTIQIENEDYEVAKRHFTKSLSTMSKTYGPDHPFLIESYQGITEASISLGDFEAAKSYAYKLLEIYRSNEMNVTWAYNLLGNLHQDWPSYEHLALAYYDSAMLFNAPAIIDGEVISSLPEEYSWSLRGKCQILLTNERIKMDEVEALFGKVVNLIQQVNQLVPNKNLKKNINETLDIFYQAYEMLSEDSRHQEVANQRKWEIIQMNRASKLKAQLQDQYSMTYSIPEAVLAQEKQLKDSLDAKIGLMKPGTLDSSLFVMKRAYDDFILELEKDYPRYAQLKKEEELSQLVEVRKQLHPKERVLAFFEGQTKLYLMSITRDDVISKSLDKSKVYEQIAQFNKAIFSHALPDLITLSAEIKADFLLDAEAIEGTHHIRVAPDGDIWKLDFGSLPAEEYGEGLYLSQQLTFSYDMLLEDFDPIQDVGSEEVVAFSYGGLDEASSPTGSISFRDLNSDLPGTSEEVKAISEIWQGRYYYANLATETVFKNEATQLSAAPILHLALHGYQDDIYPENSFLKFATEDSLNDGRLHSYELYNLRLNAPLAVLSACNSGSGKVEAGEGIVSLGRAFAYAGVQSILATRWKVPDHTAPVIMEFFYEGLKDGMKKSEALQYAQAQYLENANNVEKAPFFWAGYYILGNDEPIVNTGTLRYWASMLGLLLVIAGYFILRRRS